MTLHHAVLHNFIVVYEILSVIEILICLYQGISYSGYLSADSVT